MRERKRVCWWKERMRGRGRTEGRRDKFSEREGKGEEVKSEVIRE